VEGIADDLQERLLQELSREAQMKNLSRALIPSAISIALLAAPVFAQDATDTKRDSQHDGTQNAKQDAAAAAHPEELGTITVVSQRASRVSNGATNLDLEIKETPQSISDVTQSQMQQFGATDLDEALRLATGIQVESVSTNQTQYLSRGFEIKSTQIDGVGMPNGWGLVTGAMDSFGYEKLEVIRGANGLLTGVGNAAGTINYVRKRPTNEEQGMFGVSVGSFGDKRIEADYSTPFNDSRTWAGRVVVAREDSDSYLRDFNSDRTFLYGVVDGQVGDNGTLAFGYSWQKADTSGNMWGQLTFVANDGSQLDWDRSASTTQDWTHWNTTTQTGFVEYTHQFGPNWQLKATYNYRQYANDSQLFLAYSSTGLDPVTGEGLYGWAYKSPYRTNAHIGDITLNGSYQLFGRDQQAVFGASSAKSEGTEWYNPTSFTGPAFGALPGFPYAGDAIPEPTWGPRTFYDQLNQGLKRAFAVTRLSFTDRLKAIVGVNWAEYHRDGVDTTLTPFDQTVSNTSPYAGLTFDFTDNVLGYVSYSDIFIPQDQVDYDNKYLDPSKGLNYEAGIKAEWLDHRLLTTFALFDAKQQGLATYAGIRFLPDYAYAYYTGVDIESKGVEFEATGKINEFTNLVFGYTHLTMDGTSGGDTYPWVPRNTANLLLTVRVPSYTALSFGIGGRWQSEVSNHDSYSGFLVKQGAYARLNAFAAWDVRPNLTVRANVENLTDEKYINSLYIASYYAAPRRYSLSLDWRF
jgi:outer membrane receptor for ferric coprogen and ferric-rhodotorulic acid